MPFSFKRNFFSVVFVWEIFNFDVFEILSFLTTKYEKSCKRRQYWTPKLILSCPTMKTRILPRKGFEIWSARWALYFGPFDQHFFLGLLVFYSILWCQNFVRQFPSFLVVRPSTLILAWLRSFELFSQATPDPPNSA